MDPRINPRTNSRRANSRANPRTYSRRPRRVRRRYSRTGLIIIAVFFTAIGVGIFFMIANIITMAFNSNSPEVVEAGLFDNDYGDYPPEEEITEFAPGIPGVPMRVEDINDTGYLVLVNRQHAISPNSNLLVPLSPPEIPVRTIVGMYLHPTARQAVADMFSSSRRAGFDGLFVTSGYRGYALQTELYGDGDDAYVLPPGHSEHHTGLAADILVLDMGMGVEIMANSPEGHWLADNSYRYGLILRYPRGSEPITGVPFEPWHFRYVGRVHAYYMHRNNLVLEEYIQLIQDRGVINIRHGGITYYVAFQEVQDGMLHIPYGMNFAVSNDNSRGYIFTAW